jgi:membrane protease subunit HflC
MELRTTARRIGRMAWLAAAALACVVWLSLSVVTVGAGQALLVTHFGRPAGVLTRPGVYLTWPSPLRGLVEVDTRLRVTMGALRDVVTRDGQPMRVQAFVAWRVPPEADPVQLFVRAGGDASRDIEGLVDSALPGVASGFAAAEFFAARPGAGWLGQFAERLKDAVAGRAHEAFGVTVLQVGVAQLTLPEAVLAATEARMRAARVAEAGARAAQAQLQAAEIRAEASRDSRIALAEAQTEAAQIEAASRKEAADIEAKAYNADPDLYLMLRSLDTLSTMVGPSTRLVLRTDAAPFNMLVQGPPLDPGK